VDRADGYPGLAKKYHFDMNPKNVNRMEHSLTYQAIDQNAVDVIDVYSTDAKIRKFNLRVLDDDPAISRVPGRLVARKAFVDRYPAQWQALGKLAGTIDVNTMLDMNAKPISTSAAMRRLPPSSAAHSHTSRTLSRAAIAHRTFEQPAAGCHLAAVLDQSSALPLGIAAVRVSRHRPGHPAAQRHESRPYRHSPCCASSSRCSVWLNENPPSWRCVCTACCRSC